MKHTCTILCSAVGGAILGSAITIFLTPKSGSEMRREVQEMIISQMQNLQDQIKQCSCAITGECSPTSNE